MHTRALHKPKEKKVKEPAPPKAAEADEAEEYEQVPRGKLNEKEQGPRAAPLPLKVGGQLVYPDSKEAAASKPAPVHASFCLLVGMADNGLFCFGLRQISPLMFERFRARFCELVVSSLRQ